MALPFDPPLAPMLAFSAEEIPVGEDWLYEPKWDGFRTLIFRDQSKIEILSRNGLSLRRYFPELIPVIEQALPEQCVLDGEIVIVGPRGLDFDALQARVHPAESRIAKLSKETPARIIGFDLLALGKEDLRSQNLSERRQLLVNAIIKHERIGITPQTIDIDQAKAWFKQYEGAGLDGVIAKLSQGIYQPGERVWVKIKHRRTADCVVGGYRVASKGGGVGSLLLGLYDAEKVLHYVGHTSSFSASERREVGELLKPLEGGTSFGQGRTPGAINRWSKGKNLEWTAISPKLVCEISFDQLQGNRFRHAGRFLRWRVDKSPTDCIFEQLESPNFFDLTQIIK